MLSLRCPREDEMSSSTESRPRDADEPASPPTLVVGIGASAGGIRAIKELFSHTAADSGAAFVVILHLSPDHERRRRNRRGSGAR